MPFVAGRNPEEAMRRHCRPEAVTCCGNTPNEGLPFSEGALQKKMPVENEAFGFRKALRLFWQQAFLIFTF